MRSDAVPEPGGDLARCDNIGLHGSSHQIQLQQLHVHGAGDLIFRPAIVGRFLIFPSEQLHPKDEMISGLTMVTKYHKS